MRRSPQGLLTEIHAPQDLTMMLPSRLGCPMSQKTPNMGNIGLLSITYELFRGSLGYSLDHAHDSN